MLMTMDGDMKCAQNLSHECAMCIINRDCEQCAICADSMHVVRHAIVEVNVVIGVLVVHGELLVVVRVVPVFLDCDAVVHRIRSHSCYTVAIVFIVAILRRILLYWRDSVYTDVTDVADFYRVQDHGRWCVGAHIQAFTFLSQDHGRLPDECISKHSR